MRKIAFIIPPSVEILDLAGPMQVFTEAKFYDFEAEIEFYLFSAEPVSTSGLGFNTIRHFSEARLQEGDFIFMPGMGYDYVNSISFGAQRDFFHWLKEASSRKIIVCSVFNGAFALGKAGLLDNTECTKRWRP